MQFGLIFNFCDLLAIFFYLAAFVPADISGYGLLKNFEFT